MATFRHRGAAEDFLWESRDRITWIGTITPAGHVTSTHKDFVLKDKAYSSALYGKEELLKDLVAHRDSGLHPGSIKILGVWTGQWSTDLFVIPRDEAIAHLEQVLGKKGKSR